MTAVKVVVQQKSAVPSSKDGNKSVSTYRSKHDAKKSTENRAVKGKKPSVKSKHKPKAKPVVPGNIIYSSLELTSGGNADAKILQFNLVIPDTKPNSVDFKRASILCNNAGVEISTEAQAYHGITQEMVADAPLAKDITLPTYGYIALWDGFVGNILLNTNEVNIRKGSLVDLHKLLRFSKKNASHMLTLKKAAIEATNDSLTTEQVEGFLANSENKVLLLPVIMDYIRKVYETQYGITDLASLARLSRQSSKKAFTETLNRIKENEARKKSLSGKRKFKPGLKKTGNSKRAINLPTNDKQRGALEKFPRQKHHGQAATVKAVA